jgi:hypothetical protein
MGFKVQTSPTFWRKVKLAQTGEDGTIVEGEFKRAVQAPEEGRDQGAQREGRGQVEVLPEHVLPLMSDWKDYTTSNGRRALQQGRARGAVAAPCPVRRPRS